MCWFLRKGRGEEARGGSKRTDLIHFDNVEFGAEVGEECFGGGAVGAVGFGEDGWCRLLVDVKSRYDRRRLRDRRRAERMGRYEELPMGEMDRSDGNMERRTYQRRSHQ